MSSDRIPTSYRYQEALANLTRQIDDDRLRKKLSEVLTLLDFNSTLNQSLALSEILDLVLYVSMGETRASWAGLLLREKEDKLSAAARRGRSDPGWSSLSFSLPPEQPAIVGRADAGSSWAQEILSRTGAALASPLTKSGRLVGVLLLGERDRPYETEERVFVEALCASAAASIDNGRIYEEMRELNRSLSFKVYQLHSLFDITRELNRSPDEARVREILLTNAMGHILTTRAVLLHQGAVVEQRGLKLELEDRLGLEKHYDTLTTSSEERTVETFDPGELRELLFRLGMNIVVPLKAGENVHGVLLLGPRASGKTFAREDRDFLRSLASQAAAALDHLRLNREWIEKQRIEKEMVLAREIQSGLLPDSEPGIEGWDIAGINIPCLTVGGDYFDYLHRGGSTYWLVIADVAGKGTGAALLMASVQAALHALAGLGDIALEALGGRLNEIVYRSTEANRYVTAVFASLDTETGELEFVNAGHCYPLVLRADGTIDTLIEGGPVIGLLPEIELEGGRTGLAPGDLLVMYTDGLSETRSPASEEFEETRIVELMRSSKGQPSREILARLVAGVRVFAGQAGLTDDLTLVVVQRAE